MLALALQQDAQRWELYRLLGEPVRLRLLALCGEDELSVGELAELLGESQSQISRHAAPLREAGLLRARRQGTRTFLLTPRELRDDAVLDDALRSGLSLVEADGSLVRVAQLVAERESAGRAYFGAQRADASRVAASPAYAAAMAALLPRRELAIDAGTGDGSLLEALAPVFSRVLAFDREASQLELAERRVQAAGLRNVELRLSEPREVASEWAGQADVVFAVRMLHHAAKPAQLVKTLASLLRPADAAGEAGALVVIDYAAHDDENMRQAADQWLGFSEAELRGFAKQAGLHVSALLRVPPPNAGPDAHLPWLSMVARPKP